MEARRVFIVGDTLFAETLGRMLAGSGAVEVAGSAPTPEAALLLLAGLCPDVVIVASTRDLSSATFARLLAAHPDLPIIRADLGTNDVRMITSQRVGARSSDLPAPIPPLSQHT